MIKAVFAYNIKDITIKEDKRVKKMSVCVLVTCIFICLCMKNTSGTADESSIKGSPVYGTLEESCIVYDGIEGTPINIAEKGKPVEILKDRSEKWYYIRFGRSLGWVKGNVLYIPPDPPTNTQLLSEKETLEYARENFKSDTEYFVWVDIDRQRVYILRENNGWELCRTIICSTGRNKTPTVRGFYKLEDRGEEFYSQRLGSGARYWVRYSGSYLFHSLPVDKEGNITDSTLGKRHSSGCVRMSMEDAKWFYDTIPMYTGVYVS